jgi:hypothetical protein
MMSMDKLIWAFTPPQGPIYRVPAVVGYCGIIERLFTFSGLDVIILTSKATIDLRNACKITPGLPVLVGGRGKMGAVHPPELANLDDSTFLDKQKTDMVLSC